ncbi:MAG: sulfatase [bacterium]|nr:sulfatase [bacterium]
MTTRRSFLKAMGLTVAATGIATNTLAQAASAPKRPNILFIMSDDHAAHAISAYGSRINKTPNLDRLANEGVLFQNVFVTNSICTPSRACIVSGMFSCQNGVPVFNDISTNIKTIGGVMRDAGYFTALLGKWHLGGPHTMRDQDWDRWAIYQGQGPYFDPYYFSKPSRCPVGLEKHFNQQQTVISFPGEYASHNITKLTKCAVDEALAQNKPFFIMMLHKAPHRNWLPEPKYRDKFRAMTLEDFPLPESIFDDYKGRASPIKTTAMTLEHHMRIEADLKLTEYFTNGGKYPGVDPQQYISGESKNRWPKELRDNKDLAPAERERRRRERIKLSYLRYMQDYLGCCQSVDDSIGDMLKYLDEKGVGNDTIVMYTADQGFFLGDHGLYDKRFMLNESLKMPFLMRWPNGIKAGQVNTDIITNVDFSPTFADAGKAKALPNWQGRSFLPCVTTGTPADWPKSAYYRYYIEGGEHGTPAHYGVTTKRYKLINYYKRNEWELFDRENDPEEYINRYNDPNYRAIKDALTTELYRLKAKYNDHDQFYNANEGNPNPAPRTDVNVF